MFNDGGGNEPKRRELLVLKAGRGSDGSARVLDDLQSKVIKAESRISRTPPRPTDLAIISLACNLGSNVAASNLV